LRVDVLDPDLINGNDGNRPTDQVGDLFAADRTQGGLQGDGRSGYQ